MKRSNLMFIVLAASIIFFGCSKDDSLAPLSQNDQETNLKKAKVKRTFEGICTPVDNGDENVNEWYDATDDWRTTGTTIWEMGEGFFGTATLFVDAKNPHDENRGIWDIEWAGTITPNDEGTGVVIVATATGIGAEGKVKGMNGLWTYTMNYIFAETDESFPDPNNPTCFYVIEGNIDKPQGPIKK